MQRCADPARGDRVPAASPASRVSSGLGDGLPATSVSMLRRLGDGDAGAWLEFDRYHRALVLAWARRFGCPDDLAEDVCQESMVAVLRALPGFRHGGGRGSFHGFLKTVVRRRVADLFRQRSGRGSSQAEVGGGPDVEPADAEPADTSEDVVWVRELVRQAALSVFDCIEPSTYKAFVLYVIDGVSPEETARRLGMERPATVYQQKSRVLNAVRKEVVRLLDCLQDPELSRGIRRLRGPEAIALLGDMLHETPSLRLTRAVAAPALDRIALARQALALAGEQRESACLVVPGAGRVCPLPGERVIVGSRDADLLLEGSGVSGAHCVLHSEAGDWSVRDQTSRNGVRVNGRVVGSSRLSDGDVITLGDAQVVFLTGEGTAGAVG